MELKLIEGEYAASGGRLETVSGAEETAQRIMMKLCARRGGFAPMPDYGSRLYTLGQTHASGLEAAARQYIAEALRGENAELCELRLEKSGDGLELVMKITAGGASFSVTAPV